MCDFYSECSLRLQGGCTTSMRGTKRGLLLDSFILKWVGGLVGGTLKVHKRCMHLIVITRNNWWLWHSCAVRKSIQEVLIFLRCIHLTNHVYTLQKIQTLMGQGAKREFGANYFLPYLRKTVFANNSFSKVFRALAQFFLIRFGNSEQKSNRNCREPHSLL